MNKMLLTISMLAMLLIMACAQQPSQDQPTNTDGDAQQPCTADNPEITYIAKGEQCSLIKFACAPEYEPFEDSCGCGCAPIKEAEGKLKVTDCTPKQKQVEICTMEYLPVCGWFDPAKIQCIKYPCASTFGNKCQACAAESVISWSEGECPTG